MTPLFGLSWYVLRFIEPFCCFFSYKEHLSSFSSLFSFLPFLFSLFPQQDTLNIYDGVWPPLASHVVLEFWQDAQKNTYIEIIYNGRGLTQLMKVFIFYSLMFVLYIVLEW